MFIKKSEIEPTTNSRSTVKLIPRYVNSSIKVNDGDLARRIIDESYSPEQSASIKRFEERLLGIVFRKKRA